MAQFYWDGADPARAHWRQLRAGPYTVIYPQEVDSLAKRYAFLFEQATSSVLAPLRANTPSIPVVLHPYSMYSNGMVVWTPKRMELYTTPPAHSYAQNWEKQLVLHETRHVGQMSKLSQNFFRIAEYLVGQQSQGVAVGGYTPKWMLEGDAVLSETELSFSGRGREAAFLMPYKAYLLDSISFSWDVWRFGSYKHFTPNHYQFGYLLLSTVRTRTSEDVLSGVYDAITKRPYIPFISQIAFSKEAGSSHLESWASATEEMCAIWNRQSDQNVPLTTYHTLIDSVPLPSTNPYNKTNWKKPAAQYANYESIVSISSDLVYAFYQNFDLAPSLVRIDLDGKKSIERFVGHTNNDLTSGGGKLYWTEIVPDIRWEKQSFSLLRSYDPNTKELTSLSKKSRYLHPSLSPSAQKIAVVNESVSGRSSLHILSAEDGSNISQISAPDGGHLRSSAWASDTLLYATVLTDTGLGIYSLHIEKGIWHNVIPPQHCSISRLHYSNGLLLFSSDINGTDNIYALYLESELPQLFALTQAKYGAFSPYMFHNTLYYTNYTYAGLRPVEAPIDNLLWKRASFKEPYEPPIATILSQQSAYKIDTVQVPAYSSYPSKPYHKALNIFRFHSWAPIYYDVDNLSALSLESWYDVASLGAVLLSQNTLGTAATQLGYSYRNGFHSGHLKYIWQGWYPIIEITGHLNDRYAGQYQIEKNQEGNNVSKLFTLDKPSFRASASIYVPFNLRSRGWVRGLIPRLYLSFRNDQYLSPQKQIFQNYLSFQTGVQYYQYRHLAQNNIFPRIGFGLSIQSAAAPWNHQTFGKELYGMAYAYLPGVVINQGLRLKIALQRQWIESGQYFLSSLASWPRGYDNRGSEKYAGFNVDYAIPVWLGDISVGSILYLKRLQILPFFDWANTHTGKDTKSLYSVGADLLFDFHFLRIGSPISAGVRSLLRDDQKAVVQALFSVNIQ
jgi:hypothetical protein